MSQLNLFKQQNKRRKEKSISLILETSSELDKFSKIIETNQNLKEVYYYFKAVLKINNIKLKISTNENQ